ncbi:armadillo-type protein [Kockiozyma suomiensis]|uniref:armadillo-type protein n=1 Tax=Kockiozyma suomiensis TaxID=1337062 RepID=UPI003343A687
MCGSQANSLSEILPDLGSTDPTSQSRAVAVLRLAGLLQNDNTGSTRSDLKSYLNDLLEKFNDKSLILAFSIMTTLFHIDTRLAGEIFVSASKSTNEQLISGKQLANAEVLEQLLSMLSAACVDKKCRTEVETKYAKAVTSALESPSASPSAQALAASILVKLAATPRPPSTTADKNQEEQLQSDLNVLSDLLRDIVISSKSVDSSFTNALEGLTYSSLNATVKKTLIDDIHCLQILLSVLKDKSPVSAPPSLVYGVLTILQNLTAYPEVLSKEKEQVAKLKKYANNGKDSNVEEEKPEDITKRCKALLDLGIISSLASCAPAATSNGQKVIGAIMKSLVTEKQYRPLIMQQGGISVLLTILKPARKTPVTSSLGDFKIQADEQPNYDAAAALSRLLISVNPTLAFSSRNSPAAAVNPLLGQIDLISEGTTLLDTFEALLALTNLASMETGSVGDVITSRGWEKIESCLLSDNKLIQRAASELVCNLSGSPEAAAKYLDKDDKAHTKRLRILVALADSEDQKTRSGAAGALAILSQWAPAGDVFLESEQNLRGILHILQDKDQDVLIRGSVCVNNLLSGAQGNSTVASAAKEIRRAGGLDIIEEALKNKKLNGEVKAALDDCRMRILSVSP